MLLLMSAPIPDPSSQIADLNTLLEVSRRLGATTELTPLLEQITQAAVDVLNCERATVFLYDRVAHQLISRVATGTGEIRFSADLGIAGECVRTGKIINVPDAYADPRFNREIDKATGYRTRNLLTFPMKGHDGQLVGVLQVLNRRSAPFGRREEELASTLSLLAGVAVQRQMLLDEYAAKQKLERDLALARQIQQSLLPEADPAACGYSIAGFNEPADATGGDCYDYLELPGGGIGLLIADATGHGIGPALVVSQCRAMLRTLVAVGHDILTAMCRVNDLVAHDLPAGMFITMFLGVFDPARNTIEYVSAGHGPLLLYKLADDDAVELSADCMPLGIVSPLEVEAPAPLLLSAGDAFLLVTDGFFEWADPAGEQFGTQRIFDIVRRHPEASAGELITLIRENLKSFARGTSQKDDLTAIVIKRQ